MADTDTSGNPTFNHPQGQSQPGTHVPGSQALAQIATLQSQIAALGATQAQQVVFNTGIIGLVQTVTVPPTGVPASPYQQLKIYNGQWYYYDSLNNVWDTTAPSFGAFFGDGSDGVGTADGATSLAGATLTLGKYTLTRDVYYTNLTLSGTTYINTAGYRIFVNGTLTIGSGTNIQNNGGNGGNGANGASGTPGAGGTAGAATPAGTLSASVAGAAGGVGGTANGGAGQIPGNGSNVTHSLTPTDSASSGSGGNGGAGNGGSNPHGNGSAAGSTGTWTAASTFPRTVLYAFSAYDYGTSSLWTTSNSTGGGGGGGAGGGDGSDTGGYGGGGGGSGAAGGIVVVIAATIINNATAGIQALGGNGGNGGNGTNSISNNGGGAGGGGGGASGTGGALLIVYQSLTQNGTFSVAAGTAGAFGTRGVALNSGLNGSNGSAGTAASAGVIYQLQF